MRPERERTMNPRWSQAIAVPFFLFGARAHAQSGLEVRRLADGIYAALQPSALRFDDSNSAIIILDDGVFVVDTQNSPAGARAVIAEIRKLTDKPVRWVLNTHWHGDHVQGNQLYREQFPGVQFLAHATVAEDIRERAAVQHAQDMKDVPAWLERARAALASGAVNGQTLSEDEKEQLRGRIQRREAHLSRIREVTEFVVPTRTFEDSLTIQNGRTLRLQHFPGHTRGDVAVWLPAERILITGDLLDDLPFTGHGSPAALVRTLQKLDALSFEQMVPGHGAVRTGSVHLRQVAALFESIVRQVSEARRNALTLEVAQKRVDLNAFRAYFVTDEVSARYWDFFMAEAVRRAWEETEGASR
jgi:glyoxylase-like metal-dependent hydrolase (beta-lactamase superfamily II)